MDFLPILKLQTSLGVTALMEPSVLLVVIWDFQVNDAQKSRPRFYWDVCIHMFGLQDTTWTEEVMHRTKCLTITKVKPDQTESNFEVIHVCNTVLQENLVEMWFGSKKDIWQRLWLWVCGCVACMSIPVICVHFLGEFPELMQPDVQLKEPPD
jgi:hypothetical protein